MRPRTPIRRTVLGTVILSIAFAGLGALAGEASSRGERIAALLERLAEADALRSAGKIAAAGPIYRESLAEADALETVLLPLARAVDGLADFEREQGRTSDAERLYLRSTELWERLLGPDQPRLAVSLHNLGVLYLDRGECASATVYLRRAHAIWVANYGEGSEQARNTARGLRDCHDSPATKSDTSGRFSVPNGSPATDNSRHPR